MDTTAEQRTYIAMLFENHDVISIAIYDNTDLNALENIHVLSEDLGVYPGGFDNTNLRQDVLTWMRDNGWVVIGESTWRVGDTLHIEPAGLLRVTAAASRVGQAERDRDNAIRMALTTGHSVISVANAAGLSRARIYQIRDGRR